MLAAIAPNLTADLSGAIREILLISLPFNLTNSSLAVNEIAAGILLMVEPAAGFEETTRECACAIGAASINRENVTTSNRFIFGKDISAHDIKRPSAAAATEGLLLGARTTT